MKLIYSNSNQQIFSDDSLKQIYVLGAFATLKEAIAIFSKFYLEVNSTSDNFYEVVNSLNILVNAYDWQFCSIANYLEN